MKNLRKFLNSLSPQEQSSYAERCGTTVNYLRKAISEHQKDPARGGRLGEVLCIRLEIESGGAVLRESLRADVDWAYLCGTEKEVA